MVFSEGDIAGLEDALIRLEAQQKNEGSQIVNHTVKIGAIFYQAIINN